MTLSSKKLVRALTILAISLSAFSIVFMGNQRLAHADPPPDPQGIFCIIDGIFEGAGSPLNPIFDTECGDNETPTHCSDGIDNDGDDLVDMNDVGCSSASDNDETNAPAPPQCADGIDNDGDGYTDLGDPNCANAEDNTEAGTLPQCADFIDNDGDGKTDFVPVLGDPGCDNIFDDSEGGDTPPAPQCNDGIDNDGDGFTDLGDPNCENAEDTSESGILPQCADGVDNDEDGKTDFVPVIGDPGCDNIFDDSESGDTPPPPPGTENTLPLCSDGIDNDSDELVDLSDPDCVSFMPKLVVVKRVINDNVGTSTVADFSLYIAKSATTTVVSGATTTVSAGTWTVGEIAQSGYTSTFSGDCNASGHVTLVAGETKTCVITNNDAGTAPPQPAACADGKDNDEDDKIDMSDPGCSSTEDADETDTPPAPSGGGNGPLSGAGTAPGGGGNGPIVAQGIVLGASTSTPGVLGVNCNALLTTYLRKGRANNVQEVKKLQEFLNKEVGAGLPVTGFFGPLTEAAVNKFQIKYSSDVLTPWLTHGLPNSQSATGYVYKTTQRKINLVHCSSLSIPMPTLP